jgi:trimethylamine--corrinoid protein Co-methyltransferase
MVSNTTKPIVYTATTLDGAKRTISMAEDVAGGKEAFRQRPFAIMYIEPISPLCFAPVVMEKLLLCADKGIPCIFISGMLSGGTGPVTPAGSLALANAESLAGTLIAQLKREGTPVISGGGVLTFDMKTTISCYGAPEFMISNAACAEIAHYYNLPAWGYAGCTDAKVFDEQAAADAASWILMSALAGSNLVHDMGYVESGLTSSFDMLVFCDEMVGKTKHIVQGIPVDDETLAVAITHEVGPGGEFLNHDHTYRHFRSNWVPTLENRQNYAAWVASKRLTMRERVNAKVRHILENHRSAPIPPDVDKLLRSLLQSADNCTVEVNSR